MANDNIIRKQHTGQAGNGGEFGNHNRAEADLRLTQSSAPGSTTVAADLSALVPESDPWHNDFDRLSRLALTCFVEPGDPEVGALIREFGAERTLDALVNGNQAGIKISDELSARAPSFGSVQQAIRSARRFGIDVMTEEDADYPVQLKDLGDRAPYALYTRGDRSLLDSPDIMSIGGARAATGYGEHVTMEFAVSLSERGQTIVTGGAYGIDSMATRATLAARGKAIAVLGGGVDRFYPSGHDELLARVVEAGVVVGELPPGSPPTKDRFLQRNRIIAALSSRTLIVEAGSRSGSLGTAREAAELGRPVFAVPGPVTSAASAGTRLLIREGVAKIAASVDDLF